MRLPFLLGISLVLALGCKGGGSSVRTAAEIQKEAEKQGKIDDTDYSELGVAVYPASTLPKDLPPLVRSSNKDGATIDVFRVTSDTPEQVGAFYKGKLTDVVETNAGTGIAIEGINSAIERVRITANRPEGAKETAIVISVTKSSGPAKKP